MTGTGVVARGLYSAGLSSRAGPIRGWGLIRPWVSGSFGRPPGGAGARVIARFSHLFGSGGAHHHEIA